MAATLIDVRDYATLPRLDVPRALALGRALLAAAPDKQPKLARRARKHLEDELDALETAWQPARLLEKRDKRPVDLRVDNGWGGVHDRLAAWQRLDPERVPQVDRASAVLATVFPDGLAFTQLAYDKQWAESERRLKQIDALDLADEIDALAGPTFLAELRQAHATYGEVLGITAAAAPAAPDAVALLEPLRAVCDAIRDWVVRLIGTLDDEDPEAVAGVRAALRPIDELRSAIANKTTPTQPATVEPEPEPAA